MCESMAYLRREDGEELLLREVTSVEPVAGGYRLRNLFGEELTVRGSIGEINLLQHKILFEEK